MLFNSEVFLLAFLPVTFVVFWSLRGRQLRYLWLVLTGYVFYAFWRPSFCLLMAFSTCVSYIAGVGFLYATQRWQRRALLVIPVTVDLSLLGYFKYADFAIGTVNSLALFSDHDLPLLHIVLPVGISFYTFHTISYIVDAYRGEITPTKDFLEFATYVSLFSQLVAGPIIRFRELQDDLETISDKRWTYGLERGCSFFALGMIQKVLIADPIASYIDPFLGREAAMSSGTAWLCALGYAYQLLLDFAGYSNMAIGLGLMFGMHIPQNFNRPYQAANPSDFWRRWHMSLSRFLRDYLYIPLGGSRGGEVRADCNLMITMLLGGLWHGPSWTFVAWGGYHGFLLVFYRHARRMWDGLPLLLQRSLTFLLVVVGWVLFRSRSFADASSALHRMFIPGSGLNIDHAGALVVLLIVAGCVTHLMPSSYELSHRWTPAQSVAITLLFLIAVFRVVGSASSPFLYFQF